MKFDISVDSRADLATAWQVLTDVTTWPRWTASMTSVERLDSGPLRVGSRARIKQPGLPSMIWEVTHLREEVEFTWIARTPGARTVGRHLVHGNPDGTTRITLEIDQSGVLGVVVAALIAGRTRRFLAMESAGLSAASEAAAAKG